MYLLLLSFTEIGLSLPLIIVLVVFGGFFLISFFITSPNMDTKGLLRVLYSKPVRKADGTVEYPESRNIKYSTCPILARTFFNLFLTLLNE